MRKRGWVAMMFTALLLACLAFYTYRARVSNPVSARNQMLDLLPADAEAVIYADVAALRTSPFAAELYEWVPKNQIDSDYAKFERETGFDYARDLNRVAIAVIKGGQARKLFAVADGQFDQSKIATYAGSNGSRENRDGEDFFTTSAALGTQTVSFTFLSKTRLAITNSPDPAHILKGSDTNNEDKREMRERFDRLAGSPIFAVLRQDAGAGSALAAQAPGGLQSPQLATLLDQMQWITAAGKPENDHLRVVLEGEAASDRTTRQLQDFLSGMLLLAQTGLNGSNVRQRLDPKVRDAYLEVLKAAEVSRIDRGETKSVRLVFDITPTLLEVARHSATIAPAPSGVPEEPVANRPPGKTLRRPSSQSK